MQPRHQHGSAARDAAVAAFVTKFEFMDALVSEGKSVGNLLITAPEWEVGYGFCEVQH